MLDKYYEDKYRAYMCLFRMNKLKRNKDKVARILFTCYKLIILKSPTILMTLPSSLKICSSEDA